MLNVCICDDREKDLSVVRKLMDDFSEEHPEYPLRLHFYRDPDRLMSDIQKEGGFDIYLLDVVMPNMSGMTIAEKIRERGEKSEILFLAASREYAVEAFGVKATGYLLKPVKKEGFDEALMTCIRRLEHRAPQYLLIKTKDGLRRLPISELMQIESFNHTRRIRMSNGTSIDTAATLSQLYDELKHYGCFFLPHRAYIVNLDYVDGLNAKDLHMTDGERIPVSRGRYRELRTAYLDYMTGRCFD